MQDSAAPSPLESPTNAAQPRSEGTRSGRGRRWAWTLLVVWLVVTYAPLSRTILRGPVYTRASDGSWSVHNEDVRVWRGLRTAAAVGTPAVELATQIEDRTVDRPFPCQRIWVLCRTPGAMAHRLAEELTLALLERPGIQEVGWFTFRQLPNSAFRPPDLWITIDQLESESWTLPGHVRAQGRLQVRLAPSVTAAPRDVMAGPHWVGQLTYETQHSGWIPAAARWGPTARALLAALPLDAVLDRWQGPLERALPPVDVRWLHAPIRCETIQPLKAHLTRVQQIAEGPAWMMHDVTAWTILPEENTQATAQSLMRDLQAEGWQSLGNLEGMARFTLGQRQIDLRPLYGKADQSLLEERWSAEDQRPLVLLHLHPFSTEECAQYLREVAREGLPEASLRSLIVHLAPTRRQALRTWLRELAPEVRAAQTSAQRDLDARLLQLLHDES